MHEPKLKDGASHNNDKAASISTDVDTLSTNISNVNISNSKNSVSEGAGHDKDEEILSNKKEYTSLAQNIEQCNTDNGKREQYSLGSNNCVGGKSDNNEDENFISYDELFKDPPPKNDCPLCMLPMPFAADVCGVSTSYQGCCGKVLCCGCGFASALEINKGNMKEWCSFCRVPIQCSEKEFIKRFKKRMKLNDADAFYHLGLEYRNGNKGLPQDYEKAIELYSKAAELGSLRADYNLAVLYMKGQVTEQDMDKAIHHYEQAAIGGHEVARYILGMLEEEDGNLDRAMKHFVIAAKSGEERSLKKVGEGYKDGHVTKDEYASTLRAYQHSCDEMKSEDRSKYEEFLRYKDGHVSKAEYIKTLRGY